jgi:hypothetical protein
MESTLIAPANATFLGIPAIIFSILIPLIGIGVFMFIVIRRLTPLAKAAPDFRRDRIIERLSNTFLYPHHRMPRYMLAGAIHITILSGFIILSLRWIELVISGITGPIEFQGIGSFLESFYRNVREFSASLVLIASVVGIIRRGIFKPERYSVPSQYGKEHTWETLLGLFLIAALMICDMFFQGSLVAAHIQQGLGTEFLIPGTGVWLAVNLLGETTVQKLQSIHLSAFYAHELIFFFFLCFLPFGRFFHLVVSIPNLFSMKLNKGTIKPVKHGVSEDQLDALESFGVKKFEDFTWKHLLDFYACADCGRCSDRCPANAVGRPLSPRFISIKCR